MHSNLSDFKNRAFSVRGKRQRPDTKTARTGNNSSHTLLFVTIAEGYRG